METLSVKQLYDILYREDHRDEINKKRRERYQRDKEKIRIINKAKAIEKKRIKKETAANFKKEHEELKKENEKLKKENETLTARLKEVFLL